MRLLPCADSAVLVELGDLEEVLELYTALVDAPADGVVDLVPAARTLLIRIDPTLTDVSQAVRWIRAVEPRRGVRPRAGRVEIPVTYDGADLVEVGRLTGLGSRGVVEAHTGQEWTVAFCGFAPGFGYLVGDDERLRVPRLDTPRTRVPAGSVALADGFTGVYPRESPGGWQLIGHTEALVWNVDRDPPALLVPGVRVRFVEAG